MRKTIRQKLPTEYSIGILILLYTMSYFLSGRLFHLHLHSSDESPSMSIAMLLASTTVIVMILILWEELLFPVKIRHVDNDILFRNYRNKLKIQVLMYLVIPVIVVWIYLNYPVNYYTYIPWALVCLVLPVASKLVSGINNFNDFLRLSDTEIEYKNNEKEGIIRIENVVQIELIKDSDGFLSKLDLKFQDNSNLIIDLDEMELEAYYESIEEYITEHYASLCK